MTPQEILELFGYDTIEELDLSIKECDRMARHANDSLREFAELVKQENKI